jgi:hypothetical protein
VKKHKRNEHLHIRIQPRLLEKLRNESNENKTQADIIEAMLLKRYRLSNGR